MIYKVIVDQKTNSDRLFDYFSNDEIEPLTLVEVPFSNRKLRAIVLRKSESSKFAKREIIRKLSLGPIFTNLQFELAEQIAGYFLSNLSESIFSFLPNLNKSDLAKVGIAKIVRKTRGYKIKLVIGEIETRTSYYAQKIDLTRQNLIVMPTIYSLNSTALKLHKLHPSLEIIVWQSSLKSAEKAIIWQKLLHGDRLIIIGTRHSLFLPFADLANIMIDDPTNFAYQEDQSPYYNAFSASKLMGNVYGTPLTVGEDAPDINSFIGLKQKKIELKQIDSVLDITCHNKWNKINQEIDFVEKIESRLKNGQRLLIIGPWRDQIKLFCRDCNLEISCPRCQNEHFSLENQCLSCGMFLDSLVCPNCKSSKIISLGFTYKKISDELVSYWPEFKNQITSNPKHFTSHQLIICSPNDVSYLKPSFDLVFFPYFDMMLDFPFLNFRQKIYRLVRGLHSLDIKHVFLFGEKIDEIEFVRDLTNNRWEDFLMRELQERKHLALPPFTRAVRIVAKANSEVRAEELLKKYLAESKINKAQISAKKHKGKMFISEATVFIPHNNFAKVSANLRENLTNNIHLEVDPTEFL